MLILFKFIRYKLLIKTKNKYYIRISLCVDWVPNHRNTEIRHKINPHAIVSLHVILILFVHVKIGVHRQFVIHGHLSPDIVESIKRIPRISHRNLIVPRVPHLSRHRVPIIEMSEREALLHLLHRKLVRVDVTHQIGSL